jgi:hypothetical protein
MAEKQALVPEEKQIANSNPKVFATLFSNNFT